MIENFELFKRIDTLREQKKLTVYRLSKDAILSQSIYHRWRDSNILPSIQSLDAYCDVLGITLSELFAEEETFDEAATERRRIFTLLEKLTDEQRKNVLVMLDALVKNEQN